MNKTNSPLVGILMGSDSDWPVMKAAAEALAEFGIAAKPRSFPRTATRTGWRNMSAARQRAA